MANEKNYTTRNGFNYFELVSALQKDIRRGNEREACFWAVELEDYNPYLLWRRLVVIASEDIGPANNEAALLVDLLYRRYMEYRAKKNGAYRLFLIHAVLALCRSQKSREVDEVICLLYPKQAMGLDLPKIPDYAYDMHTYRGKRMGRGVEHFYEEGAKISPVSVEWVERNRLEGKPEWYSPYTNEVANFERDPDVKEWWRKAAEAMYLKVEDSYPDPEKTEVPKTLSDFLKKDPGKESNKNGVA